MKKQIVLSSIFLGIGSFVQAASVAAKEGQENQNLDDSFKSEGDEQLRTIKKLTALWKAGSAKSQLFNRDGDLINGQLQMYRHGDGTEVLMKKEHEGDFSLRSIQNVNGRWVVKGKWRPLARNTELFKNLQSVAQPHNYGLMLKGGLGAGGY